MFGRKRAINQMKKWKTMWKIISAVILLGVIGYAVYKGNTTVGMSYYEVVSDQLPASFDTYTIVQLSDVHDSLFGENHADVVGEVKEVSPQAIFITGDFIDRNRYDLEQSLQLVKQLQGIAPIYYVTGNHEVSTNDTNRITEALRELDVRVLLDEAEIITTEQNELIAIGGIEDPLSSKLEDEEATTISVHRTFETIPSDMYKILLAHRPEQFSVYAENKIDVIFSGHAHGGQFRIPGIGGLVSPGQGFFPKLTSGVYAKDGSQLVVSRGLGNSIMPIRLFNKPEIVVVTLRK